jgi:hypothetical protein
LPSTGKKTICVVFAVTTKPLFVTSEGLFATPEGSSGVGKVLSEPSEGIAREDETSAGASEGSGKPPKPLGTTTKGLFNPERLPTR